jgi:protease I
MTNRKALILTWTGFQDQEVVYPYYRLLVAGYEVTIVSDSKDWRGRTYGIFGTNMPCHMDIKEFYDNIPNILATYTLLVIPGGVKALEKLRLEKRVIDFIRQWDRSFRIIASTCHGAQLLISADIIRGKTICGYYSIEDDIRNAGAIYSQKPCEVSVNIVSSPHYDFMGEWMETVLQEVDKNV